MYRYKAIRDCTVRLGKRSMAMEKEDKIASSSPIDSPHLVLLNGASAPPSPEPVEPLVVPEPEEPEEEEVPGVIFDPVEWNAIISALPNKPTIVEFGRRVGVDDLKVKSDRQEIIDTIVKFMRELPLEKVEAARQLLV